MNKELRSTNDELQTMNDELGQQSPMLRPRMARRDHAPDQPS